MSEEYICTNLPFNLSPAEKSNFKRQYWFILVYEESVNDDYINILKDSQYKIAISPWHDKDIETDGSIKKKHRHILIDFGGGAKIKQVGDLCKSINAPTRFQFVGNKQGAFEYLTHKNDLDKYQYNECDIILINSKMYDWVQSAYKDILNYIDDNNIKSLKKLTVSLRKDNNDYLLKYISQNSYFVCQYLRELQIEYDDKIKDLLYYIDNLIKDYEIDSLIKSESLKAIQSKLDILGLDFNIVVE